ncbi:MAG TPA: NAD(P)/FAD-dependent oxidoreductase [Steroidobacteraceae bacterium]|nr:NAD(P)/FAD-dependent oxidoreductase [Steroidobacteraceae bacterium]
MRVHAGHDHPGDDGVGDTKRVVIVGGGFAGITLAEQLEHRLPAGWTLTLVSQENFITYNPLLPEVVGASIMPGHVVAPLRQMIHCSSVCMAQVSEIDLDQKVVHYLGEGTGRLHYDQLVLAVGVQANLQLVKGMAQYALPLKTLGDALFLRNRIIARLEQAELQPDPEARRWLTTFVVIGGGFSGVETAGELVDFLHASLRYYPRIRAEDLRVVLLHGQDRLLPELSRTLGEFAYRKMHMQGLDVRLNARAVRIDDRCVTLADGELIPAGTVISTIGTVPNPLLADLPFTRDRGRVVTAPDMSVPGHPGVWALGDCAAVPNMLDGKVSPPTAQFADRQARVLARNIAASLAGRPTRPFKYKPAGQLSSIGHNKAVAEMFGLRISGFVAWLLWRGVYLLKIPTLSRKARLFLEWNWAMFFPPDISHLGFRRTRRDAPPPAARSKAAAVASATMVTARPVSGAADNGGPVMDEPTPLDPGMVDAPPATPVALHA